MQLKAKWEVVHVVLAEKPNVKQQGDILNVSNVNNLRTGLVEFCCDDFIQLISV